MDLPSPLESLNGGRSGSEARPLGLESRLCCTPPVCPWASYATSLCSSFLIYKLGTITALTSWVLV